MCLPGSPSDTDAAATDVGLAPANDPTSVGPTSQPTARSVVGSSLTEFGCPEGALGRILLGTLPRQGGRDGRRTGIEGTSRVVRAGWIRPRRRRRPPAGRP